MKIQWKHEDGTLQTLTVPPDGLRIGRTAEYDIQLAYKTVSGSHPHALIKPEGDRFVVVDCNSKNGTKVNGRRIDPDRPVPLAPRDIIEIGDAQLECIDDRESRRNAIHQVGGQTARHEECTPVRSELSIPLPGDKNLLTIGRAAVCDIVLDDSAASSRHAEIRTTPQGPVLTDLDSKNGTYVNEKRITQPTLLKPTDRVRIGRSRFKMPDKRRAESQSVVDLDQVSDGKQIRVDARGLRRTVEGANGPVTLLEDVSLTIEPGKMVALIGGSGAGKTTLMLALNGYVKADEGEVLLNGVDFYQNAERFRTTLGYVPQQDIVHGDLPVASALRYAAQLRLPPDTTDAEIETMVDQVLDQLSLTKYKYNMIATLSGGQRKRVNIGVELLTRPSLIFFDEPTTGLDAGTEKKVTLLMRELAEQGCTIITVTHAVTTLELYDSVIVMAPGGRLVYYGPLHREDLQREFGLDDYADLYDKLPDRKSITALRGTPRVDESTGVLRAQQSSFAQWIALMRRYGEILRYDRRNLLQLAVQTPLVAVLIGLLFHADTYSPIQQSLGEFSQIADSPKIVLLMVLALVCFCMLNSYREIIKEMPIYNRERHVSLRIWPYIFSKLVMLTGISAVQLLGLLVIVQAKISLHLDSGEMLRLFFLLLLGCINATLIGLLISALSKSSDQATTTTGILLLVQVIFSGFISIPSEAMSNFSKIFAMHWMYLSVGNVLHTQERAQSYVDGLAKKVSEATGSSAMGDQAAELGKQAVAAGQQAVHTQKIPGALQSFSVPFDEAIKNLSLLAVVTLALVWLALWLPEHLALRKGS